MNTKKKYIAPAFEVYPFEVEKGFNLSLTGLTQAMFDVDASNQELWTWSDDDNENRFGGTTENWTTWQ